MSFCLGWDHLMSFCLGIAQHCLLAEELRNFSEGGLQLLSISSEGGGPDALTLPPRNP